MLKKTIIYGFQSLVLFICMVSHPVVAKPQVNVDQNNTQKSVTIVQVPATDGLDMPVWQKAPTGIGEFFPFPGTVTVGYRVDEHRFEATYSGTLVTEGNKRWHIAPDLYLRNLYPVFKEENTLWARDPNYLVAVDLQDWSIKAQAPLPMRSQPFTVRDNHIWCLEDNPFSNYSVNSSVNISGTSVVQYDMKGNELYRFKLPNNEIRPQTSDPYTIAPFSLIIWAAVDKNYVWLGVRVYPNLSYYTYQKGDPFGGGVIYDLSLVEFQLVRMDRQSGERIELECEGGLETKCFELSDHILLVNSSKDQPGKIYKIDKENLQVEFLGRIDPVYSSYINTDGENLWFVCSKYNKIISLSDLNSVKVVKNDYPPVYLPPARFGDTCTPDILGGDAERLWLEVPGGLIVEINDDDTVRARDLSKWYHEAIKGFSAAISRPGLLYVQGNGCLIRLDANSENLTVNPTKSRLFAAGDSMVVTQPETRRQFIFFPPDLTRQIGTLKHDINHALGLFKGAAAIASELYLFDYEADNLYKIRAHTGSITPVDSWRVWADSWLEKNQKGKGKHWPNLRTLNHLAEPIKVISLPDGKIRFFYKFSYRMGPLYQVDPLLIVTYDSNTDQWQSRWFGDSIGMFQRNHYSDANLLYDSKTNEILLYQNNRWTRRGPLPSELLFYAAHATRRYLYAKTPLGLYRVPWTDLEIP